MKVSQWQIPLIWWLWLSCFTKDYYWWVSSPRENFVQPDDQILLWTNGLALSLVLTKDLLNAYFVNCFASVTTNALCVLWVRLSRTWRRSGTRILLLNSFNGWCHLSSNTAWMLTLFPITESHLFESIEIPWMTDDWSPTSEKFKRFCIKRYKTCFQAITLTSIGIFTSCDKY